MRMLSFRPPPALPRMLLVGVLMLQLVYLASGGRPGRGHELETAPADHELPNFKLDAEANHHYARMRRKALPDKSHLWPNATIYYTISDGIKADPHAITAIADAIAHWQERTCIQFLYTMPNETRLLGDVKYVRFVKGSGCHSSVGRKEGTGVQDVSIGKGCAYAEMMIHELGHLVGMWHEHARMDRDNNVIIMKNNIKEGMAYNFIKVPMMKLVTPYDLSSMMHYDMRTFSANGHPTIVPIDRRLEFLIGYRSDLSFYDIKTSNQIYECSAPCPPSTPPCENEGFLLADCTCHCPEILKGKQCQNIDTSIECGGIVLVNDTTTLTSPGYPKRYGHNLQCAWLIKSPPDTYMTLTFEDLDIERSHYGVCNDALEIRYQPIGIERGPIFCGRNSSEVLTSFGDRVIMRMTSNGFGSGRGFNITVKVKPQLDCLSNPCLNGGSCYMLTKAKTYMCLCQEKFVGKNCEIPIVDGGLGEWTAWSTCHASCGLRKRTRACNDPAPQNGGESCTGTIYQTKRCGDYHICRDAFYCDFGVAQEPAECDLVESDQEEAVWGSHYGRTPSVNTGPPFGHTYGTEIDRYYYLEASSADKYHKSIFWLPQSKWRIGTYCLQFYYNMNGANVATLSVLRRWKSSNKHTSLWQRSGDHGQQWIEANVDVLLYKNVQIGFEGVTGDAYDSDIALDDVSISPGPCQYTLSKKKPYGCSTESGDRLPVGEYSHYTKCSKHHCFCNQDAHLDCPKWQIENVCQRKFFSSKDLFDSKMASIKPKPSIMRAPLRGYKVYGLNVPAM